MNQVVSENQRSATIRSTSPQRLPETPLPHRRGDRSKRVLIVQVGSRHAPSPTHPRTETASTDRVGHQRLPVESRVTSQEISSLVIRPRDRPSIRLVVVKIGPFRSQPKQKTHDCSKTKTSLGPRTTPVLPTDSRNVTRRLRKRIVATPFGQQRSRSRRARTVSFARNPFRNRRLPPAAHRGPVEPTQNGLPRL